MFTFDEVAAILDDIVDGLPDGALRNLNGGVCLLPEVKHNARIPSPRYYVLGQYVRHPVLGRTIYLYYGSFMAMYVDASEQELRRELTHTLWHELRHHWEGMAGSKDLELEDEKFVRRALARLEQATNRRSG